MRRVFFAVLFLLALPMTVFAQSLTSVCSGTGTNITYTGRTVTFGWVMPATITVTTSDGTMTAVPNRVDGFYVQVDNGAKQDIGLATSGAPCASGPYTGYTPYMWTTSYGFQKGSHTFVATAWNFKLDPVTGAKTTDRQEGAATSFPFDVIDVVVDVPPTGVIVTGIVPR